jgi:hypothetical protein
MTGSKRSPVRPKPDIAIVAHARETLRALETYLERAGFFPQTSRFLGHPREMVPASCRVLVFFPDDFPPPAVDAALGDLAPLQVNTLLVTSTPDRFAAWLGEKLDTRLVLVKPVWAWNIADAMRAWTTELRTKRPKR